MSRALIANGQRLPLGVLPLNAHYVWYVVVLAVVAPRALLERISPVLNSIVLAFVSLDLSVFLYF